jgi:hypothetical protein
MNRVVWRSNIPSRSGALGVAPAGGCAQGMGEPGGDRALAQREVRTCLPRHAGSVTFRRRILRSLGNPRRAGRIARRGNSEGMQRFKSDATSVPQAVIA